MSSAIARSDLLHHGSVSGSDCAFGCGLKCLPLFSLLKPPWLHLRLRFGLITLTKPSHGPSKPIDDPREVHLTKLRPQRLKDIDGHVIEVDACPSALAVELFEGVANLVHRSIKLFLRQLNRYWPYDALCQIRHFGLHVEGCIHHFRSLPMCGLLPYPVLIRSERCLRPPVEIAGATKARRRPGL